MILGFAGAYLGHRLPVPAGVLLGTLVAVGTVSIVSPFLGLPNVPVPPGSMPVVQVMLGIMVGLRMDRDALRSGIHALLPASVLSVAIIAISIASALVADALTSMNAITALFAAAPGGLTEMTTTSTTFAETDPIAVATVQLARVLLAITIVDVLMSRTRSGKDGEQDQSGDSSGKDGYKEELKGLAVAAPWGILGGAIGIALQIPAGGIIGALAGSAAFELLTGRSVPIARFQVVVQVVSGVVIGLGVSSDFLSELGQLAVAGAVIISVQMVFWLAIAWLLIKFSGYDGLTSALATSPGGLSGVIPAAEETRADSVVVTFMQLVRLSTIVVVVPVVASLFFSD